MEFFADISVVRTPSAKSGFGNIVWCLSPVVCTDQTIGSIVKNVGI